MPTDWLLQLALKALWPVAKALWEIVRLLWDALRSKRGISRADAQLRR